MTGRSTSDAMLRWPSKDWMDAISASSAACRSSAESGNETPKSPRHSRAVASASA